MLIKIDDKYKVEIPEPIIAYFDEGHSLIGLAETVDLFSLQRKMPNGTTQFSAIDIEEVDKRGIVRFVVEMLKKMNEETTVSVSKDKPSK